MGIYADIEEAAQHMTRPAEVFEPIPRTGSCTASCTRACTQDLRTVAALGTRRFSGSRGIRSCRCRGGVIATASGSRSCSAMDMRLALGRKCRWLGPHAADVVIWSHENRRTDFSGCAMRWPTCRATGAGRARTRQRFRGRNASCMCAGHALREALVPGCSYVALPKAGGGTYYAYITSTGAVRMTGSLAGGGLRFPVSGQSWPGIIAPGGLVTVDVRRAEVTGAPCSRRCDGIDSAVQRDA